jgi:2-dehydropantoate 2-reductase
MKYLVIGAGGTGGCLAAYLGAAGKDVHVIARGEHLKAIQNNGLVLETGHRGTFAVQVKASDMDSYQDTPDVILLCVKGYSTQDCVPFIQRVAGPNTVVVPILNGFNIGGMLQPSLPGLLVTDGCIYVAAEIKAPGTILMSGAVLKVFFGVRKQEEYRPVLEEIAKDLADSGIGGGLTDNIQRDALQKFSFVSPMAACGLYYDVKAQSMQQEGVERETFVALVKEVEALATAMNITFPVDIVSNNLGILDNLAPGASTSLKRDVDAGKNSELDTLLFHVVRLGREYGVDTPWYNRVAEKMGFQG